MPSQTFHQYRNIYIIITISSQNDPAHARRLRPRSAMSPAAKVNWRAEQERSTFTRGGARYHSLAPGYSLAVLSGLQGRPLHMLGQTAICNAVLPQRAAAVSRDFHISYNYFEMRLSDSVNKVFCFSLTP
jgi:hypothetical protein